MVILIDPGVLAGLLLKRLLSRTDNPGQPSLPRRTPSVRRWRLRFLQLPPPAASTPIATTRLCSGSGLCRQLPSNASRRGRASYGSSWRSSIKRASHALRSTARRRTSPATTHTARWCTRLEPLPGVR